MSKQSRWEKEWALLRKQEEKLISRSARERSFKPGQALERLIPGKLKQTLNAAFYKAFVMVFSKGTDIIEKTYAREKLENNYKINEYADSLYQNRKSLRAFSRQAAAGNTRNLLISGVEGVGLGVLGIGIWDIPVFTGLVLKSIYEIAMSYGFRYDTDRERYLILRLIRAALTYGPEAVRQNQEIDALIAALNVRKDVPVPETPESEEKQDDRMWEWQEEMRATADILAGELLYLKFVQGIPIAGVIGGLSDAVYLKRITTYAALKYKRRFLLTSI